MLKVGLIGCGFMGGMHSACYNEIEGAQLVAVADVRPEKTEEISKKYGVSEIYSTGIELIEKADVDIIDICLPTFLHAAHAELAMKKGVHVFIEKPVCLTKEEGKKLLKLEKETGAKVQVGQAVRFSDAWAWLKKIVDTKEYGELRSLVLQRLSATPTWGWENWLHNPERSGSVALDLHVHDVDYARFLLGEPDSFTSHAERNEKGVIEQIFTTFTYGKKIVTIEGCWDYPADFPFEECYRAKFDKATVVSTCANGITVYPAQGGQLKPEIVSSFEGTNDIGGNVSDLGEYYNELKYFIERLAANEPLEVAPLCEGVKSVNLALDEIESVGGARI